MVITKYFYVDDGSAGANRLEQVKKLANDLEEAMAIGGFSLAKWKYSHPELMKREGDEEQDEKQSILGIGWNTKRDSLHVVIDDEKFITPATTPRMVVQQQAALYDPMGMVAPFILLGRQWTQSAMQGPWGWDIRL